MTLRINRSFREVVGNDSVKFAQLWITKLAENMQISKYRFKNPVIIIGKKIFN